VSLVMHGGRLKDETQVGSAVDGAGGQAAIASGNPSTGWLGDARTAMGTTLRCHTKNVAPTFDTSRWGA